MLLSPLFKDTTKFLSDINNLNKTLGKSVCSGSISADFSNIDFLSICFTSEKAYEYIFIDRAFYSE